MKNEPSIEVLRIKKIGKYVLLFIVVVFVINFVLSMFTTIESGFV
jgi:t-SNARE complex subunit (syntaxin)